ncbi:hypothetical protein DFH09DRAFT_1324092 [Mycena vulgaris]|nr:hypothetical protein DFH09DRAFT_1324092 [Mycena vulgaris]
MTSAQCGQSNGNYMCCCILAVLKNPSVSSTFPASDFVVPGGPDPRIMVPLVVEEYITYSGAKTAEGILEVYALEVNLGIYTARGTQPRYLTCEETIYAIVNPDPTVETGGTRAVAFGSDVGTTVEWFAIDVDPCTSEETERVCNPSTFV